MSKVVDATFRYVRNVVRDDPNTPLPGEEFAGRVYGDGYLDALKDVAKQAFEVAKEEANLRSLRAWKGDVVK